MDASTSGRKDVLSEGGAKGYEGAKLELIAAILQALTPTRRCRLRPTNSWACALMCSFVSPETITNNHSFLSDKYTVVTCKDCL